jgi:diaminopropionate ammonia-lyase
MPRQCGEAPHCACHIDGMQQRDLVDAKDDLRFLMAGHPATRLLEVPRLALRAHVGRVLLKAEWERPLGNFKVLGGMLAGLRALARHCGAGSVAELLGNAGHLRGLPELVCASDGNHGLAVAAAARRAGAAATIYLPRGCGGARIRRIETQGAKVVLVSGTYDDAVESAERSAARGGALLVPDTTRDPAHIVVREVMSGYALIASELIGQFRDVDATPTHVFVQAGVGGLAAAIADGFASTMAAPRKLFVVEPASAACVARALATGRPVRIDGPLDTCAAMLSCGLASAPAIETLGSAGAVSAEVDEAGLLAAVGVLSELAGVTTTPSGAAGLAGLLQLASQPELCSKYGLDAESRVLLLITEGPVER